MITRKWMKEEKTFHLCFFSALFSGTKLWFMLYCSYFNQPPGFFFFPIKLQKTDRRLPVKQLAKLQSEAWIEKSVASVEAAAVQRTL